MLFLVVVVVVVPTAVVDRGWQHVRWCGGVIVALLLVPFMVEGVGGSIDSVATAVVGFLCAVVMQRGMCKEHITASPHPHITRKKRETINIFHGSGENVQLRKCGRMWWKRDLVTSLPLP